LKEWIPTIRVLCFYGNAEERDMQKETIRNR
jgi:hypothetical protein